MAGPSIRKLPTLVLALIVPVIAVLAVLITLNATSDDSSAGNAGGTAVSIKNFQFSPNPIAVKAGSALSVTNRDGTPHTFTADDKSFDTGDINGGVQATVKIGAPGKYAYHCDIHNYMTGTIEAK
jgi:plastocyanin